MRHVDLTNDMAFRMWGRNKPAFAKASLSAALSVALSVKRVAETPSRLPRESIRQYLFRWSIGERVDMRDYTVTAYMRARHPRLYRMRVMVCDSDLAVRHTVLSGLCERQDFQI